jgi:hypothetical protein
MYLRLSSVVKVGLVLFLAIAPGISKAAIRYVDARATGANTGTSWDDAYPTLRQALTEANPGDEIWVAAGTYTPGDTTSQSFALLTLVAVYGGLAGDETPQTFNPPDVDNRDLEANETILSGDLGGGTRSTTIVTATGVDRTAILDGFTITGAGQHAVALYGTSSPWLKNLRIAYNQSTVNGAGLCMDGANKASAPRITTTPSGKC